MRSKLTSPTVDIEPPLSADVNKTRVLCQLQINLLSATGVNLIVQNLIDEEAKQNVEFLLVPHELL